MSRRDKYLSVIMPWRNSPHPSRKRNRDFVLGHLRSTFPAAEFLLCDDSDPERFNRGRALNLGVEASTRPLLLFADADLLLPSEVLWDAVIKSQEAFSFIVPFSKLVFLNDIASSAIIRGSHRNPFHAWGEQFVDMRWGKGVGTCNVMRRDLFDEVGGFEPRHRGWGFEDASFHICCDALLGDSVKWLPGEGIHLWHPTSRHPEDAAFQPSWDLCRRYEATCGDVEKIRALIGERQNG